MKLSKQLKEELRSYLRDRLSRSKSHAQIFAPYELSPTEVEEIKKKVPLIQDSPVDVIVDTSILAGIVIRHGSKLIDYSLKSKLESLFSNS